MSTPPNPAAAATTEFDLLGALLSPAGRADPQVILRGSPLPDRELLFFVLAGHQTTTPC